ncbi:MAG TPA: helix-turn-helix transcriptional regulator [Roseiflexaceae bacterium]|nr:helix-turn-helix transcriptional regulator [Roseiflexaceae bacterium]
MSSPDGSMGRVAVGAYLRRLRDARGYTQIEVAVELEEHESQIHRLESGKTTVNAAVMFGTMRVVGGDPNDMIDLLLDPDDFADKGLRAADRRLDTQQSAVQALAETRFGYASERIEAEIRTILLHLAADQLRMGKWLGYGRRLADKQGDSD